MPCTLSPPSGRGVFGKGQFHPETNCHSWFSTPRANCRKKGFLCRVKSKIHLPAERYIFLQRHASVLQKKCLFLQKNAISCRKTRFSGGTGQEKCRNWRRVSGLKNQERYPTFTRQLQFSREFLTLGHSGNVLPAHVQKLLSESFLFLKGNPKNLFGLFFSFYLAGQTGLT